MISALNLRSTTQSQKGRERFRLHKGLLHTELWRSQFLLLDWWNCIATSICYEDAIKWEASVLYEKQKLDGQATQCVLLLLVSWQTWLFFKLYHHRGRIQMRTTNKLYFKIHRKHNSCIIWQDKNLNKEWGETHLRNDEDQALNSKQPGVYWRLW